MSRLWIVFVILGTVGLALGCATEKPDGDGDADSDADADSDSDADGGVRECPPVDALAACDLDGADTAPALLEAGCDIDSHTLRMDVVIADPDPRLDKRIAKAGLTLSISPSDRSTFPLSPDVSAYVNGCEIPHDAVLEYTWVMDEETMNVVLTGGKHYVFEVRELGEVGQARLFYREDLVMPGVLPNIVAPAMNETLPDPDTRDAHVELSWEPFDLSQATWAVTTAVELRAWLLAGAREPIEDTCDVRDNVDGTRGEDQFNCGVFDEWDWILMIARLSNAQNAVTIDVGRHVN